MKLFRLASLVVLASTAFGVDQAVALTQDDKSMNDSSGGARFSDPDEKTPVAVYMQDGPSSANAVDQTTVRYDYDPASGSYVPHK